MDSSAANKKLLTQSLDVESYQELRNDLVLKNNTSEVVYLKTKLIKIDELKEDSICITLPKNVCQAGHSLTLVIYLDRLKKAPLKLPSPDSTNSITLIGKVIEISTIDEERVSIELKFTQYKSVEWKRIINKYLEQQNKISSLVEEVKK